MDLIGDQGVSRALAAGDIDGDGWTDLMIGRGAGGGLGSESPVLVNLGMADGSWQGMVVAESLAAGDTRGLALAALASILIE